MPENSVVIKIVVCVVCAYAVVGIAYMILRRRALYWPEYQDQKSQAGQFHCYLEYKITEMFFDEDITYADWEELLPVCEFADDWFFSTHPHIKTNYTTANKVRGMMRKFKDEDYA